MQSISLDERAVSVQDHEASALRFEHVAADQQSMAGALLFALLDEGGPAASKDLAHLVGLVAHYDENPVGSSQPERCVHHVLDQGLTACGVQYFRFGGLHAGTESRGQYDDR